MVIREKYLRKIDGAFRFLPIVVLIGARQVGKTSLMKMVKPDGKHWMMNGQDPEIAAIFRSFSQLESYLKAYLDPDLQGLLMIDEFQFIPSVSTMLKLLTDKHEKLRILCSGSSGLAVRQQVEESLAGRARIIEVFSLSFEEYLSFKDEKLFSLFNALDVETPSSEATVPLENRLKEYLVFGGMPRVALTDQPEEKIAMLDDIYQTYLLRDIRSFVRNEHVVGFNKMIHMLAAQNGNLVNAHGISRESGLPYRVCEEFLELLQQMYIIKLIGPWTKNRGSAITKMRKVYFTDIGLLNRVNRQFSPIEFRRDSGAVFENYILLELCRNLSPGDIVKFFRTTDGTEIDFILETAYHTYALECKYASFLKPVGMKALISTHKTAPFASCYVFNKNLSEKTENLQFIPGVWAGKLNLT